MPPPPGGSWPGAPGGGQPNPGTPPYAGQPYPGTPPYPGQPYPGQPYAGYGQPQIQFGIQPPNPFESRGTTTLVLGLIALIGGFVVCGLPFLLGPVAWITGNGVRKDAVAAGYPEPGNNKGGRICGIVATAFLALAVVGIVLVVVAAAASNG